MNVDHDLLRSVHREVGDRLHREQQRRSHAGQSELVSAGEQQYAHKLIADVVREHAEQLLDRGEAPLDAETEQELSDGVFARMFGAGRLQSLLNDDEIENIDINGCDEVWVTRAGRAAHEPVDAVATSDEELIELVQSLASYAGLNSRPWDTANPELDLQLPDGSRLSAVMGVATRPSVSIRRHRFSKVELADLVGNDTITKEAADFLRALVRARLNVMIAGATRAGKTTLLRAMAAEIGPDERIITVEKALELGLRKDTDRHPNCVELEERIANSEGHGAVSMTRLVRRTLRQNPDRVIVGEVLGPEVIDMLNAMGQGNEGSMSTIHARTARDVFNRIATYAIQSHEQLPHQASFQLIAGGLDYVVFVSRHPVTGQRRLDSILEINGFDETVQASEIFAAGPTATTGFTRPEFTGPAGFIGPSGANGATFGVAAASATWTGTMPARIDRLAAAGWQPPGTAEPHRSSQSQLAAQGGW